ncbi:hypothetical protein SAMN04488059_1241 [Devosia psychrophila]|uniref:PemK-like, MazF-like toxin of type II toxin-antitoxin system n=1 Tax=Devosia psychrophila TaxID=728005 RepID=A0A1I1PZ57_9HYPH|nr:hypothetical protein SAMN04488059_1241 [Devosia psychrophila]
MVGYPYLWGWQDVQGREHGEKDRPVCLLLTMTDANGNTHLILLPISSKPPFDGQTAIEIPKLELRRANLTGYGRGWLTVSEYNYDILERSYHLDASAPPRGRFSEVFLEAIRQAFAPHLAAGNARIDRTK